MIELRVRFEVENKNEQILLKELVNSITDILQEEKILGIEYNTTNKLAELEKKFNEKAEAFGDKLKKAFK